MHMKFDHFLHFDISQLYVLMQFTNETFVTDIEINGKFNAIYRTSKLKNAYTEGEIS